jgi:hypothetical protein
LDWHKIVSQATTWNTGKIIRKKIQLKNNLNCLEGWWNSCLSVNNGVFMVIRQHLCNGNLHFNLKTKNGYSVMVLKANPWHSCTAYPQLVQIGMLFWFFFWRGRGQYTHSLHHSLTHSTTRGFKVFYNRRYFLNFRRYLKS